MSGSVAIMRPALLAALVLAACSRFAPPVVERPSGETAQLLRVGLFQRDRSVGFTGHVPVFLALRGGLVVFRDPGYPPATYDQLSLPPAALDSLLTSLGVTAALAGLDTLYALVPDTAWTPREHYLLLATASGQRLIRFRGALREDGSLDPQVPAAFREFYERLREFRPEAAEGWVAESVLVRLTPADPSYAPFLRKRSSLRRSSEPKIMDWPATLPPSDSPRWRFLPRRWEGRRIILSRAEFALMGEIPPAPLSDWPALRLGEQVYSMASRDRYPPEEAWIWLARAYGW